MGMNNYWLQLQHLLKQINDFLHWKYIVLLHKHLADDCVTEFSGHSINHKMRFDLDKGYLPWLTVKTTATNRFLSFNNSYRHVPCGELENGYVNQTESTADAVAVHMSVLQQDSGLSKFW